MRRTIIAGCVLLICGGNAAAEPVAIGGYAEPSVLAGVFTIHGEEEGEPLDQTSGTGGLRLTLGLRVDDAAGRSWRAGGSFELLATTGILAIESSVEWAVGPRWRLGPRLALGMGDDSPYGEGIRGSAGVTARYDWLTVGLDAFGGPSYFRGTGDVPAFDGWSAGVTGRIGLARRPGVYAEVTVVAITLLFAAAFSGIESH